MATIQSQPKQSPSQQKPQYNFLPQAESYQPLLEESIHHLLSQIEAGSISSFSHFHSIFSRIIQTTPSPPIEIIWFYAAVNFRTHTATNADSNLMARVVALKDLFQLLVSCSGSSGCLESVAVLAPLMFELYNLVSELKLDAVSSSDKCVGSEVDCLVEGMVSYIMICCCRGGSEHDDSPAFSPSLLDLVKVWSFERCAKDAGSSDFLEVFFPVINGEVRVTLVEGREVGYLAGIVMFEAFLLRLFLRLGGSEELKGSGEGLQTLAADTIAGLKCCYFFDVLFEMLLEPINPVIWFLVPSDDLLLRKVLFDAILFVQFPFLNPESSTQHCSSYLKSLVLTWVLVLEKALLFMRQHNDETKANSYARAFSEFLTHSELVGWLTDNHGIEELMSKPVFASPADFINWLSDLQKICSHNCSPETLKLLEKAARHRLRMNNSLQMQESVEHHNCTLLTNKSSDDVEMVQSLQHNLPAEVTESTRKRKEEERVEEDWCTPSKLLKSSHTSDGLVKSLFQFNEMKGMATEVGSSIQSHEEDMDVMVVQ